jgi:uncharacterized membrane protein
MNTKKTAILNNLLNMYKDFYPSSAIFSKSYFKYSIEDVEKVIEELLSKPKIEPKKRAGIRDEIKSIGSEEETKRFYERNLIYNKEDETSKKECLKRITLDELKYIYSQLYSSPAKAKCKKEELLSLIEKYFNGIDRALGMKP